MAFFSSTSSQIGMPGQSNYVSGLNFKDNFASYIQDKLSCPVKIFNWGYWGIGSGEQEEFRERMRKTGIQAIEPREGMEIVERVLNANESQVFILKAENKVLKQMGITSGKANSDAAANQVFQGEIRNSNGTVAGTEISVHSKQIAEEYPNKEDILAVKEFIRDYLTGIIANNLKCEKKSIENRTSFQEYGIDSILGFQIYGDLEESFGDIPTTLFLDNDNIEELVTYFMQYKQDRVHQLFYASNGRKNDGTLSNGRQSDGMQSDERKNSGRQSDDIHSDGRQNNEGQSNDGQNNELQENIWKNTASGNTESVKVVNREIVKSKLIYFLQETIAEILKCNKDSIEAQLSFEEFGIDSILGFQLLAALEASFDDLPATLFLDNANLEELSEYLLLHYSQKVKSMFGEDINKSETEAATARIQIIDSEDPASRKSTVETKDMSGSKLRGESEDMPPRKLKLQSEDMTDRKPIFESEDTAGWKPIAESENTTVWKPIAESEDTTGRKSLAESEDTTGREPIAESEDTTGWKPIAESEDTASRKPIAESEDTTDRNPIVVSEDTTGRKPIAESEDTAGRKPIAESEDTAGKKPTSESADITEKKLAENEEVKELRFSDLVKEKTKDIKLPIDLESFLVEVEDNTKIEVSIKGKGEPILIIPGLAVTTVISSYQFIELSSKYQVIGINLPGHGRSDGTEDLSFKGISEILIKVLDKLEVHQQLHVVGGSYGGIIAQNIALEYPGRVKTLTLIGSITATKFEGVAQVFSFTEAVTKDFEAVKRNARSSDVIQNIDYYFDLYKLS